jgi:hypothetical protein
MALMDLSIETKTKKPDISEIETAAFLITNNNKKKKKKTRALNFTLHVKRYVRTAVYQ